ncbi:MAG: hypothetical protein HWD86_03445 [Kangiellaceae bacterium]|nr:hypothetical protein [Kangiellaceae bacterium]
MRKALFSLLISVYGYLFLITLSVFSLFQPASASDDRFSWHPHFVEPTVVEQFIYGGYTAPASFNNHLKKLYQRDVEEFEFDADLTQILTTGKKVIEQGLQFDTVDEQWIEYQWIVVDYLFDYEQSYSKVGLIPASEQSIWPNDFSDFAGREGIFKELASENQRHPKKSCLVDSQFGICVYNYIYLSPKELEAMQDDVAGNSSTSYQDLANIIKQALSENKGLLFIGLN